MDLVTLAIANKKCLSNNSSYDDTVVKRDIKQIKNDMLRVDGTDVQQVQFAQIKDIEQLKDRVTSSTQSTLKPVEQHLMTAKGIGSTDGIIKEEGTRDLVWFKCEAGNKYVYAITGNTVGSIAYYKFLTQPAVGVAATKCEDNSWYKTSDTGEINTDFDGWILLRCQIANKDGANTTVAERVADVEYSAVDYVVRNNVEEIKNSVDKLYGDVVAYDERITALENMQNLHRYGVTGIGLANTQLTRLYDAVGITAQVGTDGDNSNVINNFDDVAPFNRRKCVGEWSMYEGKPVFHVNAYYGDPDYTEDGSMGDYVAVDCTPAYYMYDKENGTLVVSAHHYDGYRPFDCLMDRTTEECRPHTYLPCYALAVKDGHAVSLPGLRNEQGDYAKLFNTCKTADNNAASMAILMPTAVNFYEWAMFTVEFATTNCQSIMQGCASLRHSNDDLIIMNSATEGIIQNHQSARVVGEFVSIQPSTVDINTATYYASHRIVSIERCNQDGSPNASGAYDRVTFEVLDDTRSIEVGTTYKIAARPYNTGACNGVSTPSGSPVSNTSGFYPMKYRWRENVYGNQYQTVSDLMNYAVLEDGFANVNTANAAHLEWYYHRDPQTLTPTNYANSSAGKDAMIEAGWQLLDITTPAANYVNGYIKSRDHSRKYPDVWKPGVTTGASTSTYFADCAYLVASSVLRAVRLGGYWSSGASAGFSSALAPHAPSSGYASYGGGLYYPQ